MMRGNIFGCIWRHVIDCLKAGLWPFLTLAIVFAFAKFIFNLLVPDIEGYFAESALVALLSVFIIIYLIGVALRHTRLVSFLKRLYRSYPLLLVFVKIFPNKIRPREHDIIGLEILYVLNGIYFRGYVGNDPIRTVRGAVRLPIHFSSPPTGKTGGGLFEISVDDPRISFTGRTLVDHIIYILTWGGGVDLEDEDEIERFTQKMRLEIKQNPPQE